MVAEIEYTSKSEITFRGSSEVRALIGFFSAITAGLFIAVWCNTRGVDAPLDPSWSVISLIGSSMAGLIGLSATTVYDEIHIDGRAKRVKVNYFFLNSPIHSRTLDNHAVERIFTTYSRWFDGRRQDNWIRIYLMTTSGRRIQLHYGNRYLHGLRTARQLARLLDRPFCDESSASMSLPYLRWDGLKKWIDRAQRIEL